VTLFSENFDGQINKGATGAVPTVDLSNVDWSIDFSSATLSNNYRFIVRSVGVNSIFEARNVGTSIWLSPLIDITEHIDIAFTIDASQGGNNLDNEDTLTTEYRIDSGTWTTASNNGLLNNNYGNVQISQTALNGSTIEIRVTAINNANNERQRIDNIQITGFELCPTPVNPVTFNAINAPNTNIELNWNLDICNEDYLIIAKEGSIVTAAPTGDGSAYLADANFGNGTEIISDEFVVYKGALDAETISNLEFGNTYFFTLFSRRGTTWSAGTQVNFNLDYCTSAGTRDEFDTNTTLVSFGAINNNTVVDDGAAYHDYTTQSTSIEIGASEDLIINVDTDGEFFVYSYVWIDWNRDGDFDDTGETYDLGFANDTDNGPTSNSPFTITAPNDAALGDTRLRVVSQYFGVNPPTNGPCDGSTDGEVEDYTVTILPSYCESIGTRDEFDTNTTLVSFGAINNNTVVDDGAAYHDYTAQSTSIELGGTEDLIVNVDTDGAFFVYSYAWIDWNRDGDFDDAGETYDLGFANDTENGPTSNSPFTITAPNDAALGDTRLRIVSQYFGVNQPVNGPCDGSTDGEVEDYTITILPSYCESIGTRDEFDTNTTLVSFGTINNNTVVDDGAAYHDYTAQSTSIELGGTEDLIINVDTDGAFFVYSYVWIDWNRDGDFDDAGETYDLGFANETENGPTSNSPLSITMPNDTVLGDTRMRVVSQYFGVNPPTNGPCDGSTDGEVEDYTVTIIPRISYTYDNAWLPSDPNGVSTSFNDIKVIAGTANFNTTTNCNNLTVNPEGNVTVDNGVILTIDNEMILESTSTKYPSLISDGIINGTITYKRHVNNAPGVGETTTANDLLSAPLTGQSFGDFRNNNSNILSGTIGGIPSFLFGPFDPATEAYINYSTADDTSVLEAGIGYRTGSTNSSTYTFTGAVETGNVVATIVAGGDSNWNLIGNPYPSYLRAQDFLNNMFTSGVIDENAVGIYGYDGAAEDGWIIYNLATTTASTVLTPGQGFFVNAEASGNIQFTPSMRTTGTADDFILGRDASPLVLLKLNISNNTNTFTTDFYFNENASLGLDPGYDANIWNNTPPNFSIYSHLIENNTGRAMALQALHSDDLFNVTIPLGVNADNSSEITFSISESTIPDTVNVYLEDTETSILTLLSENDYVLNLDSNTNGTGRFYLRFIENQLNINEVELQTLNIFSNQTEKSIVIEGLLQQQSNIRIIDIQGRVVVSSPLKLNTNVQSINVSSLTSGIYIVQIQSNSSIKNKKVIIK
jgi:hypothetical protein